MDEPEEVIRRWRKAEERLYPIVMVRPDLYERYISVVRAVADELGCNEVEELVQSYERGAEIVAGLVRREMISTEDMDLALVTGAAFSVRHREIVTETNRKLARLRIEEAREKGAEWTTVYETGPGGDLPTPPYRRLEMRPADGVALHVFVEVDPETAGPVFGVEVVQLDPQTGDWVHEAPPPSERLTFSEPEAWREGVRRLRERYTGERPDPDSASSSEERMTDG